MSELSFQKDSKRNSSAVSIKLGLDYYEILDVRFEQVHIIVIANFKNAF